MKLTDFQKCLDGPLHHLLVGFQITRLVLALNYVAEEA
jgi:hypothetical protein